MPAYGGKIVQNVYYAASDLCDANVNTAIGYPTRDIDPDTKQMKSWPSPYILMVDRGGCTFVKKASGCSSYSSSPSYYCFYYFVSKLAFSAAITNDFFFLLLHPITMFIHPGYRILGKLQVRNAQRSGAAGVIIADNVCLCNDQECITHSQTTQCESQEPIMADDGSGADVSIPSFLMFKNDADNAKAELQANRPMQMEMAWSLPKPDNRVEYDLWTTPSDVVSKDFLKSFKVIAESLKDHAYFTPHMYIYDGIRSHCQGSSGENFCYNLCTNNGRYCATDPDNDLEKGISGADVVRESLRRLCIWNKYGATDGVGKEWWDYVTIFNDRCATSSDFFTDTDCIKDAYKNAKIDGKGIEGCMEDSGGTTKDGINSKLAGELSSQEQRGVVVIPTAFVNTAAIRGALNVNNVFTAICSGYVEGTTPDACMKCAGCSDPVNCIKKGSCVAGTAAARGSSSGGISTSFFAVSMLLVVGIFSGLGVWHYKRTRDDMRDQVRGILAEYMPLEDNDMGGSGMNGSPMDFARGGATTSLIS